MESSKEFLLTVIVIGLVIVGLGLWGRACNEADRQLYLRWCRESCTDNYKKEKQTMDKLKECHAVCELTYPEEK